MRIEEILYGIAFRGGDRVKPGSDDARRLSIFANGVLSLFRPTKKSLNAESPSAWAEQVYAMNLRGSPRVPLSAIRAAWKKSRGGFSYRDVWDVLSAAASKKDRGAAFLVFATAPRILEIVVAGKAGAMAKNALDKAMFRYFENDVQVDTDSLLQTARSFGTSDIRSKIEEYCEVQEFRIRMDRRRVNSGVFNHFMYWLSRRIDKDPPPCAGPMETEEVVRNMMTLPALASEYIDECEQHYKTPDDGMRDAIRYAMRIWP